MQDKEVYIYLGSVKDVEFLRRDHKFILFSPTAFVGNLGDSAVSTST